MQNRFHDSSIYSKVKFLLLIFFILGFQHFCLSQKDQKLDSLLIALEITKEDTNKVNLLNYLGYYLIHKTLFHDAKKYLEDALIHSEIIFFKKGIADACHYIGILNINQEKYLVALESQNRALKLYREIGNKKDIAGTYIEIGNIYNKQVNYIDAMKNYQASLLIYNEINDKKGIALINIYLGNLNIKLNKHDEARKYLINGLELSKKIGLNNGIKDAYQALTELDSIDGNFNEALEHFKRYTIYKDSLLHVSSSESISEMKTKYETEKKDIEIQQLESEKQISKWKLLVQQESLNRIRSEKAKIQAQNLFNLQQVKLLSNEQKLQKVEIEKKHSDLVAQKSEIDRKHDQVTLLNKEGDIKKLEIKKQKLIKNYLLLGLVLLGLISFFVYKYYSTRQKLKLQTLRNKIASDLHDDVGSTLSSISIFSQIAKKQSNEVIPLLDTIGDSSRKMLDAMADIVWTINPENDQFEKFILRMKGFAYELLGAKGIDFEFVADEDLSNLKLPMDVRKNLYLIFKEATNNMVKYADANKAKFVIKREKDNLIMMISDKGKGFDMNELTDGNGIKNMKKRADEIGAHLLMESCPGNGTSIQLIIAI